MLLEGSVMKWCTNILHTVTQYTSSCKHTFSQFIKILLFKLYQTGGLNTNHLYFAIYLGLKFQESSFFIIKHVAITNCLFVNTETKENPHHKVQTNVKSKARIQTYSKHSNTNACRSIAMHHVHFSTCTSIVKYTILM